MNEHSSSHDTVRLTGQLRWSSTTGRQVSQQALLQVLVEEKADDGVHTRLGETHPHGSRQIPVRDGARLNKDPPVTGHNVRGPKHQKKQGDDIEHPAKLFLGLKLLHA